MNADTVWQKDSLFDGHSHSGHTLHFDGSPEHTHGMSPMEAVLTSLCGCTSVDVVSILKKKREPITGLTVSAESEQAPDPPRVFTRIHLTYTIHGNVSRESAERAVTLSKTKYCSVSKMLEHTAKIDYSIEIIRDAE